MSSKADVTPVGCRVPSCSEDHDTHSGGLVSHAGRHGGRWPEVGRSSEDVPRGVESGNPRLVEGFSQGMTPET